MNYNHSQFPGSNMYSKNNQEAGNENIFRLNRERDRLKTFKSWTNKDVDEKELAKYGFYHKGPNDAVQCVYCKVIIEKWGIGDDPKREHIHWSSSCPFLLRRVHVNEANEPNFINQLPSLDYHEPIVDRDAINIESNRPTHRIVLPGEKAARHPTYNTQKKRLESFHKWPRSLKQTPEELSDAGLFYLGKSDHVKCFSCGGALRDWDKEDEPWIEHAKHYEHCDFVKKHKGIKFIEQAKRAPSNDANGDITSFNHENIETNDDDTTKCNICLMDDLNAIFIPCMHIYTCIKCGFSITHCPVCRQKISALNKCFFRYLLKV